MTVFKDVTKTLDARKAIAKESRYTTPGVHSTTIMLAKVKVIRVGRKAGRAHLEAIKTMLEKQTKEKNYV